MQPSFNPAELKRVSDLWNNITNPTDTSEVEVNPENVDTPETPPEPYEVGTGHLDLKAELEASGKFSNDEIENIISKDI